MIQQMYICTASENVQLRASRGIPASKISFLRPGQLSGWIVCNCQCTLPPIYTRWEEEHRRVNHILSKWGSLKKGLAAAVTLPDVAMTTVGEWESFTEGRGMGWQLEQIKRSVGK